MRKFYLALTALTLISVQNWATNLPVAYSNAPIYPTTNGSVTISINVKGTAFDTSKLDIYSGLITTKSTDISGSWQHVVPANWGDHPDSLKMKRVNDSIYSYTISNIAKFYGTTAGEGIFRITFIARDQSGNQTNNLYFEVFGNSPTDTFSTIPANPIALQILAVNLNVNKTTGSLKTYLAAHLDSSVYAYTAVNTNLGSWVHEVTPWNNVPGNSNLKLITISDSIYRLYIQPSSNSFYGVDNPAEAITNLNFVFRNFGGDSQTENIFVPLVYTAPTIISKVKSYLCYPQYPTVSSKIFIYVNANHLPRNGNYIAFNSKSTLSAWTGLITSTSADALSDWQKNPISRWQDTSISLTRLNDSIHVLTISSIASFYHINVKDTSVFRIAFIARDTTTGGGIDHQTDNLYFEIYGSVPTGLYTSQPAKPLETHAAVITVNVNKSINTGLTKHIASKMDSMVYIYTALNSGWTNEVNSWSSVPTNTNLTAFTVNDSIYRFYVYPYARSFYKVTDSCDHVYTMNIILRDSAGDAQTDNIFVPFDTTSYKACTVVNSVSTEALPELAIYPNPAIDNVMIKSANKISEISLVNIVGQKVLQLTNVNSNSANVSLANLENGLYIVSVRTENNITTIQKLIKR
jgi:hypothetical protein